MDAIEDAIATADRAWRAYGVDRAERAALAADLRADLTSAAEDGIGPDALLGADVPGFARRLADEAGVRRAPREYVRFLTTSIVGAMLGGAVGFLVLVAGYPVMVRLFDLPRSVQVPIVLAVGVYYGTAVALAVAGAVTAVRIWLRDLPYTRKTAKAMILIIPVAAVVVTPVTMGFARATGYSTRPSVVVIECVLVVAALAGAVLLARRWALREPASAPAQVVRRP